MIRFLIITFLIGASAYSSLAQLPKHLQPTPGNYLKMMALENPSEAQIDSLIQLSIQYSYVNEDSCLQLGIRSVELGKQFSQKDIYANALCNLGDSYRIFGQLDEAEKLILQGKSAAEKLLNEGQVAYAHNLLGALCMDQGKNEDAIQNYVHALEIWERLKDSQNIFKPYLNIAQIFWSQGQLEKAIEYNEKALHWAEIEDNNRSRLYAFNNQGLYYQNLSDRLRANQDTSLFDENQQKDTAEILAEKAREYYERSLVYAKVLQDKESILRSLINISKIYYNNNEVDSALNLGLQAEKIANEIGNPPLGVLNLSNLAGIYLKAGKLKQAGIYGEKALQLATANKMERYQAEANKQLHGVYRDLGEFEKSLAYFEAFHQYEVKRKQVESTEAIAEIEAKYQNAKKQQQILELENRNAQIARQRNFMLGGGFVLFILGLLGYRFQKIRKERNDKKSFAEALISAQENERKRIAQDLHDGIGQSLLLIQKQMHASHQTSLENKQLIGQTLEEVRSISRDLHPFQLEKFGFTQTIKDAVEKIGNATGLFITTDIQFIDHFLSDKASINLYRTVQEAFNNIVKHAQANAARLHIAVQKNDLIIEIKDNGKGFDPELEVARSKSLGLKTMAERITNLGGKFKIAGNKPRGTTIEIRLPIEVQKK